MNCLRVLIVDDVPDCADSLALLVEAMGHNCVVAYSGQAALAIAMSFRPTHVLLDLGMPGMDGYSVAQHLRATGCNCVLVAVSGHGQPADLQLCEEADFDYHILKPAAPSDILAVLHEPADTFVTVDW
jgi:CheY-like chemotaxis protein